MKENIVVEINIAGTKYTDTMYLVGIGAYPYDCEAKRKYPNDAVYKSASGGWITLRNLQYDAARDVYFTAPLI